MDQIARRILIVVALSLVACTAPVPQGGQSQGAPAPAPRATVSHGPLVVANRFEPATLSSKPFAAGGEITTFVNNLFNATLAMEDENGRLQPELVEVLPQLNTDTWRVLPEGRMETIYRLRSNLAWHDGFPLTSEDFVFAWRVYGAGPLNTSGSPPLSLMDAVIALDKETVLIRWSRLYPEAGTLAASFPPLPRHILTSAFDTAAQSGDWDTFVSLPYWTRDYVSNGPYRLTRWEPGAFLEAEAFDGFVLGRPNIDRITVRIILDEQAATVGLLAGDIHVGPDSALQWVHGTILKQEWEPSGRGVVLLGPGSSEATYFQFRPDYNAAPALLNVRVRRALAYAINKQDLNDGLFDGQWTAADTIIVPTVPYFANIEPMIAKYPFDPRRSEQLLTEAGYMRGSDGTWAHPTLGRLSFEHKVNDGQQNVNEGSILALGWRSQGFDVTEAVLPRALIQDPEARATFSGAFTYGSGSTESSLVNYVTTTIAGPANRWRGTNRTGWANVEYTRLYETYSATLDDTQRVQRTGELLKLINDELPAIILYFRPRVVAFAAAVKGPARLAPSGSATYNIHLWEWL